MDNQTHLQIILSDSIIGTVLPAIAHINLPHWWLAGGAVRNTVWRAIFGQECELFIKDFDIAFFDDGGNRDQELVAKSTLTAQFPQYEFDVKNQASFGRWRAGIRTYSSTEDGIKDWLHTATAVGVRMDQQGEWKFFTPYGLDDLFSGIIRPTPTHINDVNAHNKSSGFIQKCPGLRLLFL
ncbi:nucleotidyltransferase family protein [Anabaena sphaerica FACHB-251]|uniref:Nucleotidyltransferase family protein n=1 Tax=Anabaena sphaerica FACHB-251 TaxID=2692883 RepID=A0A926ZZR5_9NOST|nr:nucleotidyltransferase family protein [Anabaena sphaerica]MBD2294037.1 nucleotidyltransferase family protein [Anabaena sphaerica FACHB-251]